MRSALGSQALAEHLLDTAKNAHEPNCGSAHEALGFTLFARWDIWLPRELSEHRMCGIVAGCILTCRRKTRAFM